MKTNFMLSAQVKKNLHILVFFVLVIIFSIAWGMMSAEDSSVSSTSSSSSTNGTSSTGSGTGSDSGSGSGSDSGSGTGSGTGTGTSSGTGTGTSSGSGTGSSDTATTSSSSTPATDSGSGTGTGSTAGSSATHNDTPSSSESTSDTSGTSSTTKQSTSSTDTTPPPNEAGGTGASQKTNTTSATDVSKQGTSPGASTAQPSSADVKTSDHKNPPTTTVPIKQLPIRPAERSLTTERPKVASTVDNQSSSKIKDASHVIDDRRTAVDTTRAKLAEKINEKALDIIRHNEQVNKNVDVAKINTIRDELLRKVDSSLSVPGVLTSDDVRNLKKDIDQGVAKLDSTFDRTKKLPPSTDVLSKDIADSLDPLTAVVDIQVERIKRSGADLLYKDSNNDGISDYDSLYVFKINPLLPSPVSEHEGRKINAAEKVLLGYDPTVPELVKVAVEEPTVSRATVVPTYKVKEVALTEKKEVVLRGQALPNSFITLYIYSSPTIVTVKTNDKGEWEYIMDKELEDGEHTVYTATVNNSGNIIAKSSGYLFTKTAEAVTFVDTPIAQAATDADDPRLVDDNYFDLMVYAFIAFVLIGLVMIGISSKKRVSSGDTEQ